MEVINKKTGKKETCDKFFFGSAAYQRAESYGIEIGGKVFAAEEEIPGQRSLGYRDGFAVKREAGRDKNKIRNELKAAGWKFGWVAGQYGWYFQPSPYKLPEALGLGLLNAYELEFGREGYENGIPQKER